MHLDVDCVSVVPVVINLSGGGYLSNGSSGDSDEVLFVSYLVQSVEVGDFLSDQLILERER